MIRIKFECPSCGREWEYDLEEIGYENATYNKHLKNLDVFFEDFHVTCECGKVIGE